MIILKRILVPTDFSEASEVAVRYGVALAKVFKAKLCLLHVEVRHDFDVIVEGERVVEESLSEAVATPLPVKADDVIHSAARNLLGKALSQQEETELQVEYELRASGRGGPYVEIVRYAQESDIDLIVMGTHGRGSVGHMLMGSVAEKVVRRSPCPVLTVRHPEHGFVLPDVVPR